MNPREQRRICWPRPDATCLEGGCSYCNSYPWRDVSAILNYARRVPGGVLPNRAQGATPALEAFEYGRDAAWGNADHRTLTTPAEPKETPAR